MEMGGNAIEWGHRRNADLVAADHLPDRPRGRHPDHPRPGPRLQPQPGSPTPPRDEDPIAHLDVRNELGIREGGFGIMLARGLVDEFHYNEAGNEVTLVKRFKTKAG